MLIRANTPPGVYPFLLDPADTILSSTDYATPGDPRGVAPIPFTPGQPGRTAVTPEPASSPPDDVVDLVVAIPHPADGVLRHDVRPVRHHQ